MTNKNELVTIYTTAKKKNSSHRKTVKWMNENNVPFEVKNIGLEPLSKEEMYHILSMCDNGVEDILSVNGSDYKELVEMGIDFDELTMTELVYIVERHEGVLRYPLCVSKDALMIGYHLEEIDTFLTREERTKRFGELLEGIRKDEDHQVLSFGQNRTDYSKHKVS